MIKFENVNVTMQGKRILSDIKMKQLSEEKYIIIVVTHDYEFLNRACKRYIRINSWLLGKENGLKEEIIHSWTAWD